MKALKNWFSRRGALPLTAYLLALAVWLVLGAVHFGSDAAARAQGRLAEETNISKTAIMTQLETAQLLQISRSYVSRLETHALDQLRKGWLQESPGE